MQHCDVCRFLEFIKKSQREKAFVQACRAQALDTCQCRVSSSCNCRSEQSTFCNRSPVPVLVLGWQCEEKQSTIREHVKDLMQRWENEEQNELLRKGTKREPVYEMAKQISGNAFVVA